MKVNEIFYSLQGEGKYAGHPAVFVRLSGCNMRCWFCDTRHEDGAEISEEQIVEEVLQYPARHVVITGGEPLLQLNGRLMSMLHGAGCFVQIETNGTLPLPEGVMPDWITCSPKGNPSERLRLSPIHELKVVYEGEAQDMAPYEDIAAQEYRLQPCDVQDEVKNSHILQAAIRYILAHPKWHLSLQTHKIIKVR